MTNDGRRGRPPEADAALDMPPLPSGMRAGSMQPLPDSDRQAVTFHLDGQARGPAGRSLQPAELKTFEADFFSELAAVRSWAAKVHWQPCAVAGLRVFVSDRYEISRSLVPAWYGQSGHMEFPARRVLERRAAIAHELVHVFFPNGNRWLAEGLAVYLQAEVGGNPAFPNFGRPLHELARERLREIVPELALGDVHSLDRIHLSELDRVATPAPLELRVGQDFYGEERRGQGRIYPLAGSFVSFLIETWGAERFRWLLMQTPLVPRQHNGGSPGRWDDVYGRPLSALELEWKALMVDGTLPGEP
jgi:hypothetical protein